MILTWTEFVDLSRHIDFRMGNVIRVNGRDYCVLTSDAVEITAWPANRKYEPVPFAPLVKLRWHEIEELHIY